jgi:hypothetical protein
MEVFLKEEGGIRKWCFYQKCGKQSMEEEIAIDLEVRDKVNQFQEDNETIDEEVKGVEMINNLVRVVSCLFFQQNDGFCTS